MRSRTIREGSVGLLILLGIGLFGFMVLWLRGLNPGNRSYTMTIEFASVGGMQTGAPVRYRGVTVGEITAIRPSTNGVEVDVEIGSATLSIPRNSLIQVNQAGLIGETSIDITPNEAELPPTTVATTPLDDDCKSSPIICDGDRIAGEVGVSFSELISATVKLADLFGDEAFFGEIRALTRNSSDAAAGVAVLSREVTRLARTVDRELTSLSASAKTTTASVGRTADQLGMTAAQVNQLLAENRVALASTLSNINETTNQVRTIASGFTPLVQEGEFIRNLEALSANAAQASTNLRNVSDAFGSSENILMLQQTLESARATFQNAQKITADLDELTGDPSFRRNIRELINGLSNLLSYTEELERQTEVAQSLAAAKQELSQEAATPVATTPAVAPAPAPAAAPASAPAVAIAPQPTPIRLTLLDPSYNIQLQPFSSEADD